MVEDIKLYDNFDDNSIDTAKWDETDPNSRISETSQQLQISNPHSSTYAFGANNLLKSDISISSGLAIAQGYLDWTDVGNNGANGGFSLWVDSNNYAAVTSRATTGEVALLIVDGGSTVYFNQATGVARAQNYKITYDITTHDIKFYYWNGSAWTQAGTTQNADLGSPVFCALSSEDNTAYANADIVILDNVYLVLGDYSTQFPTSTSTSSSTSSSSSTTTTSTSTTTTSTSTTTTSTSTSITTSSSTSTSQTTTSTSITTTSTSTTTISTSTTSSTSSSTSTTDNLVFFVEREENGWSIDHPGV